MNLESEPYPKRRVDAMGAVMVLVTLAGLAGAAWLRFGRTSATEALTAIVGHEAPLLRLIDPETSEPVVLAGLNDKVVWLVFWSATSASGRSCLTEVETASRRLRTHRRFALVAAAVGGNDRSAVRAAIGAAGVNLTPYLASPETIQRFHAETADPPLHVVIDAGGGILAMARGDSRSTVARVAEEARRRLEEIDPMGETRVASSAAAVDSIADANAGRE